MTHGRHADLGRDGAETHWRRRDLTAGLSDELISALARVDGLRVIARESTALAATRSTGLAALVPHLGISRKPWRRR